MQASTFSVIFVLMLGLNLAIHFWLGRRQLKHISAHRHLVPRAFEGAVSLKGHQKSADYTCARTRLGLVDLTIGALLLLLWTLGGGLQWLHDQWQIDGWTPLWRGVGFVLSAFMLFSVLELPVSIYQTFVLEERFGFNKTTPRVFLTDLVKHALLLIVLGTPLTCAALWLMTNTGALWWCYVWLLWTAFALLLVWLYPVVIAPLFNKFTPLDDDALRERIAGLLERNKLNLSGIFVMDGSRRSGHGNAYFTGFGANKRIVFFDTLLEGLNAEEIEAVLAHEVGHFKKKHVFKQLSLSMLLSLGGLAVLGWLSGQLWFYQGLGVAEPSSEMALLLFLMIAPIFALFLRPVAAWMSRRHEFEADAFATSQTPASTLVAALVKLYEDNASTLTPDPLYSAFHDSHPPAPVRVSHLNSLAIASTTHTG